MRNRENGGGKEKERRLDTCVTLHPDVGQHDAEQGQQQQPYRGHHCQREEKMGNIIEVLLY